MDFRGEFSISVSVSGPFLVPFLPLSRGNSSISQQSFYPWREWRARWLPIADGTWTAVSMWLEVARAHSCIGHPENLETPNKLTLTLGPYPPARTWIWKIGKNEPKNKEKCHQNPIFGGIFPIFRLIFSYFPGVGGRDACFFLYFFPIFRAGGPQNPRSSRRAGPSHWEVSRGRTLVKTFRRGYRAFPAGPTPLDPTPSPPDLIRTRF